MQYGMPKLAALASPADNICFASSSVRLAYLRGMSPHLNTNRILKRSSLWPGAISRLHFKRLRFRVFFCHRFCLRRVVGYLGVLDPDSLRVHKRMNSEMREFSTVPAV